MRRCVAILGSTGSIGTQTLDVISQHRDMFEVDLLTANSSADLLIKQAIEFDVNNVVICDASKYEYVKNALKGYETKVFAGMQSVCDLVTSHRLEIIVTAMVGFSGLKPTIAALKAGKSIALANKETLVAAGSIVTDLAFRNGCAILPVDSEHSAIFQCLQGEKASIEKLLLTASGGPFLHLTKDEIKSVTVEAALKHPKWIMGAKVTIDSASMMNKGLELIEAKWLFKTDPSKIEIVVHPQSIIHSMVQFTDGSVSAQMSVPDMRLPIQYAISYPYRLNLNTTRIDFSTLSKLDFYAPDKEKFPCINIAYKSIERGGNIPCAMNAANEIAVEAFLKREISFTSIPEIIGEVIEKIYFTKDPSLDDIFETDRYARELAIINKQLHLKY